MRTYEPPPGYIDLPFTWAYDGSSLVNGQNYLNQLVYLEGGLGDFILRRIVGLDRMVDAIVGKFLIKDRNNKPVQSEPIIANGAAIEDVMIVPELSYPETGAIRFDLYDIQKSLGPQIAFRGVRRIPGTPEPLGDVHPKTFTYRMTADFTGGKNFVTSRVKIDDYPFVLEQLMIFQTVDSHCVPISDITPVVSLTIYDQNRVKISNIPILDIFCDGSPHGAYENGAFVPPLYYRKDCQIQIDFTNLNTAFPALTGVVVYLVGKQIYPC